MTPRVVARLTAPIAAVSVLLLLLTIIAAWSVRDMQQRASGPIAMSVASVTAAQELEISIREVESKLTRYLDKFDKAHLEQLPQLKKRTAAALENAEKAASSPQEIALMERTRKGYEDFILRYDNLIANPPKEGLSSEIRKLTDNVKEEILEPAHQYLRINEGMLTQASETNQHLAQRLTVGLVAVGLFGSIGGLLGGWVIAAAIRRSLMRTEEQLLTTAEQLDRAANPTGKGDPAVAWPSDPLERVSASVAAVLRRLRETERAALRAEQLAWVGQMAAGIAHEVRNPLMAIKLLVQAAADRPGGPALRTRDFQVLEEEISRLEQIVAGFLDFARPPRPNLRPVDVAELARQGLDGIRPRAEGQNVKLILEPAPRPIVASADPNQLRQVLLNLLFNALDAQPHGGDIHVGVEIDRVKPADPQVHLTVADSGSGVSPGIADRIFEPFVSTKESGLGLGLSICRRIAEAHGGTLTASDREGGGTVFTLSMPTGVREPAAAVLANGHKA